MINTGTESTISKLHKYHGNIDNIEIGQGNLKLSYNGAGILNQYFNNRSLVSILVYVLRLGVS